MTSGIQNKTVNQGQNYKPRPKLPQHGTLLSMKIKPLLSENNLVKVPLNINIVKQYLLHSFW